MIDCKTEPTSIDRVTSRASPVGGGRISIRLQFVTGNRHNCIVQGFRLAIDTWLANTNYLLNLQDGGFKEATLLFALKLFTEIVGCVLCEARTIFIKYALVAVGLLLPLPLLVGCEWVI